MNENSKKSARDLSDEALEDFYLGLSGHVPSGDDRAAYELRLLHQLGDRLLECVSQLDRQEPCDVPKGVVTELSYGLMALVQEAAWAAEVAASSFSSRVRSAERQFKKRYA